MCFKEEVMVNNVKTIFYLLMSQEGGELIIFPPPLAFNNMGTL